MKPWAKAFYLSPQWRDCREGYMKKVGGLCERCYKEGLIKPAVIVHHRIHLSPSNIGEPSITLNFDNLEALCRSCHEEVHRRGEKRYTVDREGRVHAVG